MGKIRSTLGALLNPSVSSVVLRISCITPSCNNNQSKFNQDEESSVYDSRPYKINYTRKTFKPTTHARKSSSTTKKDTKNTTMLVSHQANIGYVNNLYLTCKFYERQSYWLNKLAFLTEEIKTVEFYLDEFPEEYRDFLKRYLKVLKKIQNDSSKGFLTFVNTHPVNSFGLIAKEFVPDNCLLTAQAPAKANSSADPNYRKHKKDMRKNNIRRARNNKRKRQEVFLKDEWYTVAKKDDSYSYNDDQYMEDKPTDLSFEVPKEWLEE